MHINHSSSDDLWERHPARFYWELRPGSLLRQGRAETDEERELLGEINLGRVLLGDFNDYGEAYARDELIEDPDARLYPHNTLHLGYIPAVMAILQAATYDGFDAERLCEEALERNRDIRTRALGTAKHEHERWRSRNRLKYAPGSRRLGWICRRAS